MTNNIGSVVHFTDKNIQVYAMSQVASTSEQVYGISLLISSYLTRLFATVTRDKAALDILQYTINEPNSIRNSITDLTQGYEHFYNLKNINIQHGLTNEGRKKEVTFIIEFDDGGLFRPELITKGFGLMGKNLEISAVFACLLTCQFFIDDNNSLYNSSEIVISTINELKNWLSRISHMTIKQEVEVPPSIAKTIVDRFG